MSKHAQLADGTILEFPDDTPDAVVDRTVKIHVQTAKTQAGLATQTQYPSAQERGLSTGADLRSLPQRVFAAVTDPNEGSKYPIAQEPWTTAALFGGSVPGGPATEGMGFTQALKEGPLVKGATSLFDEIKGLKNKLTSPPPVEAPAVNKWMGVAEKDLVHGGNPGQRIVDEKLLGATKQETQANIQPKLAEASDDLHRYLQGAGAQGVEIDAHPLIDKALNEAHANLRSPTDEAFARSVAAIKGKIEARFPQYDISKLTPEQAHEVKVFLGKQIDWTDPVRNPINDALQDIYHGLNNEIDTKVVDVKPIQKRWGDLFTADQRLDKSIRKDAVGSGTGSAVPTSPSMADKLKEFGLRWAVPTGGAAGALYGLYKKFED